MNSDVNFFLFIQFIFSQSYAAMEKGDIDAVKTNFEKHKAIIDEHQKYVHVS